jgi:hypothetical protein
MRRNVYHRRRLRCRQWPERNERHFNKLRFQRFSRNLREKLDDDKFRVEERKAIIMRKFSACRTLAAAAAAGGGDENYPSYFCVYHTTL